MIVLRGTGLSTPVEENAGGWISAAASRANDALGAICRPCASSGAIIDFPKIGVSKRRERSHKARALKTVSEQFEGAIIPNKPLALTGI
jgi:hypothetical protein